jgi:hypothetical protein
MTGDDKQESSVELREQQIPISRVCGLLWNCSDIMPGDLRYDVGCPVDAFHEPITYAQAARALKRALADEQRIPEGLCL